MKVPPGNVSWPFIVCFVTLVISLIMGAAGRLTQPVATVIGSVIVPVLGFAGFRYQKYLERGSSTLEQKRQQYADYVRLVNDFVRDDARGEPAELWSLTKQVDVLLLTASDEVATEVAEHMKLVFYLARIPDDMRETMYDSLRQAVEDGLASVIYKMRREFNEMTEFLPSKARDNVFSRTTAPAD